MKILLIFEPISVEELETCIKFLIFFCQITSLIWFLWRCHETHRWTCVSWFM